MKPAAGQSVMVIGLNLYGYDSTKLEELASAVAEPISINTKPFFGNNYSSFDIVGPRGKISFSSTEVYTDDECTEEGRLEYVDFSVRCLRPAATSSTRITVFAQVCFTEKEPPASETVGVYNFTRYLRDLSFVSIYRRNVVISGLRIITERNTINIVLSDYESALHVSFGNDGVLGRNYTPIAEYGPGIAAS
ncbi:hypothetical protein [Pseudaminobacter soli (ex Li et al. 2025)]|uniref:hypothetical protein n=1 Tax=Pseudaminobacter soli (ex Li et al. 2025) TaxID=1295366 RepID=UPI0011B2241F|nr:hypothetical protein [Mesorhizobium soli]